MEATAELFFELSNPTRLALLLELQPQELRLTQLAAKVSATAPETSKHLVRLSKARIVGKNSNGAYELTSYGRFILGLLPSFQFLNRNREYFLTHDLSFLPREFVERIGELSEHKFEDHLSGMIDHGNEVSKGSEEYLWEMMDRPINIGEYPKHRENLSVRLLYVSIGREEYDLVKGMLGDRAEFRTNSNIKIALMMNEKIAGIGFPDLSGRIDVGRGLRSDNQEFHKWCHDLFSYYWDNAKKGFPRG